MEGTRHEKAAIIVVAYVIGFVTAFIAFGMQKVDNDTQDKKVSYANAQTKELTLKASVGLSAEGLYAITKDRERLLSANQDVLSASAISSDGAAGFFYSIVEAEASRNGGFIYFCEQLVAESSSCDPYIYEIATDVLHHVTTNGEATTPEIESHVSVWTGDDRLILNGATSESAETPWKLVSAS